MKTGPEVVIDIRSLINVPAVTTGITGEIYQFERPADSKLIDIVIGLQGLDNEAFQQATVNVNIYVPLIISVKTGKPVPDLPNLNRLSKLLPPLLDTQFRDTFHTDVDNPAMIYKDTDGSYFANIKVNYYSIQTNFKNL